MADLPRHAAAHRGGDLLAQPLFDHRFPRHQRDAHPFDNACRIGNNSVNSRQNNLHGIACSSCSDAGREVSADAALAMSQEDAATPVWFALRLSPTAFAIFDAFQDEAGRKAHLDGRIAAALMARVDELLAVPPSIELIDVPGVKLAGV